MTLRFRFATSADHPRLTDDDQLAVAALERRGHHAEPLVWSSPDAAGAAADAIVVRSCWDYHLEPERFAAWIDEVEARGVRLLNPAARVRANLHKRYLLELAADGVSIPPTVLVRRGEHRSLDDVADQLGARSLVVKPAISLSAYGTWRCETIDREASDRFAGQLETGDVLVQQFVPEIADGELSLVFFAGRYSHCIRKLPKPGDFRVQMDFGGTRAPAHADVTTRETAARIVERHAAGALYARVDGVVTPSGFVLMELELIDPVLFFSYAPGAADVFAETLVATVTGSSDAQSRRSRVSDADKSGARH